MVTIREVAEEAKVSVVTVSRVLNHPDMVSEKKRECVMDAIKKLGYFPNDAARSLVQEKTNVIGVLIPDINNIYIASVIPRLSASLEKFGYSILLCVTNSDSVKEGRLIRLMMEKRVDGMILLGARSIGPVRSDLEMAAKRIPVIVLDYTSDCNMYCVRTDEALGIYKAVKYLVGLGHRRIAFINGMGNYTTNHYKQAGFEQAAERFGIDARPEYILACEPYYEGGVYGANILLDMPEPPTAILTASDQLAMGVYFAAGSKGLRIPRDVSVMGFSDSQIAPFLYPPLTTVSQFGEESSEKAAKLMADILAGHEIEDRNIILEPEVVVRKSCTGISQEEE